MFKRSILISVIALFVLTTTGCTCSCKKSSTNAVKLTYWRVQDSKDTFTPLLQSYLDKHSNVQIDYVQKDSATYESDLINAIAGGNGPDLFQIRNDWVYKHLDKLASLDGMTPQEYGNTFVKAAKDSFVINNNVYSIPYSVDSLALVYNTSMLGNANIKNPPRDWSEFITDVKTMTKKKGSGFTQYGAAFGTASNISHSQDILAALMLQSGTKMVSDDRKTSTINLPSGQTDKYPGTSALDFYTSFARVNKETYTWNAKITEDSFKAFTEGKVGMIFEYPSEVNRIRNINPDLTYDLAPFPQVRGAEQRIDYGIFWGEAVNKNSSHVKEAWDLIKFLSDTKQESEYLKATLRPPSRLDLVDEQPSSGQLVFKGQSQTVQTWYKGKNPSRVDEIFEAMIDSVVSRGIPVQTAIDAAARDITTLLQQEEPIMQSAMR